MRKIKGGKMVDKFIITLGMVVSITLLASCKEEDSGVVPTPFAISEAADRAQIQQMLEEGDICNWKDETLNDIARDAIVDQIDVTVGHSNWGWSCSIDVANFIKPLDTPVSWTKPRKEEVFEASLDGNGEKDFLSGWPSTTTDWLEGSYPFYETTIGILARHYAFAVSEGVAYTSEHGRYMAFNPPEDNREHTTSTTGHLCKVFASFCVPAFFVSDGKLYPTIFRKSL